MWKAVTTILVSFTLITEPFALDLQPQTGGQSEENNCAEDSDCLPYYQCGNGFISTDGAGIIDVRKSGGPCSDYLEVCCKKSDQRIIKINTPTPPLKGCGYRQPKGIGFRIAGDKENDSQFGEFPWMAAVFVDIGNPYIPNTFRCGGALIHPQAVLTSAHCIIDSSSSFVVRVGEWDRNTSAELYKHQDVKVKSVTIHPEYNSKDLYNDIAFLYLESPVTTGEHIDVICLPPQGVIMDVGRCYATGWGENKFRKDVNQAILKRIDLPLVPNHICQENFRRTRLGKEFVLHKSFVCAGGEEGKDVCKGDGGSPLVCPIEGQEDRYYQAGIVSWGIGCGVLDVPGVYANVAAFRKWIDEQMSLNGLNITGYQY